MTLDTTALDALVIGHLRTMLDPSKGAALLSSARTIREATSHDFSQYRFFLPPETERRAVFTAGGTGGAIDPSEVIEAVPAFAAQFEAAILLGVVLHVPQRVQIYAWTGRFYEWGTIDRNKDSRYTGWRDAALAKIMHRSAFTPALAPALLALYVELGAPSGFMEHALKAATEAVRLATHALTGGGGVIDSEDLAALCTKEHWESVVEQVVAALRTRLAGAARSPEAVEVVPLPLIYPFRNFKAGTLNFGIQIVYRQSWTPLGPQAGEIIRTLPLGPRQSEKVTIEALVRSKRSTSAELATSMQSTTEASSTTTDSSEVVREASEKFNWHTDVSAGGTYGFVTAQVKAGMGGESASNSRATKSRLSEAMQKTASQLRQDTKIVVTTESESSRQTATVSEITNPNDEVAVTYVYSRLQQQYELHTYLAAVNTCVFYAEEIPAPGELTSAWIRRHDWILAKELLDPSFRPDLEAVLAFDDAVGAEGAATDPRITALMDTLTPGIPTPSGSGTIPDLYATPQAAYERELERKRSQDSEYRRYQRSLHRLQRHLYANILHYMRAIWRQEDNDSRLLRYAAIRVPIRWVFQTTQGGSMPSGEWMPDVRDEERDTAPLSDIVDPTGPIGFAGNYAVFLLNERVAYPGLDAALTDLRLPYLRHFTHGAVKHPTLQVEVRALAERRGSGAYVFTWDDTAQEWVEQATPARRFAVAPDGSFGVDGLRVWVRDANGDPGTPHDGATLEVSVEAAPILEDPELRNLRFSSPAPAAAVEAEVYDEDVLNEHAEFFTEIARAFAQLATPPKSWADLSPELQDLVRARWPQYLLRKRHTRQLLLDTNNVVLSRVVDPASSLEPFKSIHRYVDVLQAYEEAGQRRLENRRRQARLEADLLGDPDVERVTLIGDEAATVVDADPPD